MTAEIAIINRAAVTLASDSATTIEVRGARKIYTSADKIFEASATIPIGMMIYNNLEFMGLPLEVAIKYFRDSHSGAPFKTVAQAAEEFFSYLQTDLQPSVEIQSDHARSIIYPVFRRVLQTFDRTAASEWSNRKRGRTINFPKIFTDTVQAEIKRFKSVPINDSLKELRPEQIADRYTQAVNEEIKGIFEDLLRSLATLVLHGNDFSELSTGIVFAGFGQDQLFPSLHALEVDGVICDRIKWRASRKVEMSRNQLSAEILPFAQREMADRFLDGVDPEFEDGISDYIEKVLMATGNQIIGQTPRISRKTKNMLHEKLEGAVGLAIEHFRKTGVPEVKAKFRQQIEDMVLFMPKPELASLAEAMVNLTSVKRKYSAEEESVGGPVDVAVISKSEGFVWVKRKHYFDPKLNPRYFHRKYGAQRGART